MLGTCKDCGHTITRANEIPEHKGVYECGACGHPHSNSDLMPGNPDRVEVGKVYQHFKGGAYLILNIDSKNVVNYMRLSDKEIFERDLDEFESNKVLPTSEIVKRFRLLEGYSFTDGALNERERILDLIDREIEYLEYHAYSDKTFGLYRAKEIIEKLVGD